MKIWLDFSNSPHPLLFAPVARELEERGHEVLVTARDNAQTLELTRERWPQATVVGGPSPRGRRAKATAIAGRVAALRRIAKAERPDVALSHNSYAQIVAARSLRIPIVTAMDYEHQPANHLAFRLATRVVVPEWFPEDALRRFGAAPARVRRYRGFKEELYAAPATGGERDRVGVPPGLPLAVVRLPPEGALYHRGDNDLVQVVVASLLARGAAVVVLPRTETQRGLWGAAPRERLIVSDGLVDSMSLLTDADVFVGAGGTMTREAALAGIPTWSIFAGAPAAVDQALERDGRLTIVRSLEEARSIPIDRPKRPRSDGPGALLATLLRSLAEVT